MSLAICCPNCGKEATVSDDWGLLLVVETKDRQDKFVAHIKTIFVSLTPKP
jgi:RNA polymerase subunit RPABC4/transcription elongation factor Spt4